MFTFCLSSYTTTQNTIKSVVHNESKITQILVRSSGSPPWKSGTKIYCEGLKDTDRVDPKQQEDPFPASHYFCKQTNIRQGYDSKDEL